MPTLTVGGKNHTNAIIKQYLQPEQIKCTNKLSNIYLYSLILTIHMILLILLPFLLNEGKTVMCSSISQEYSEDIILNKCNIKWCMTPWIMQISLKMLQNRLRGTHPICCSVGGGRNYVIIIWMSKILNLCELKGSF